MARKCYFTNMGLKIGQHPIRIETFVGVRHKNVPNSLVVTPVTAGCCAKFCRPEPAIF